MEYIITYIIVFLCFFIELLVGIHLYFFTSKFNTNYGFRTKNTLSSETKWIFSNKRMGLYLILISVIQIIIFVPILIFLLEKFWVLIISLFPFLEVILLFSTIFIVDKQTRKLEN